MNEETLVYFSFHFYFIVHFFCRVFILFFYLLLLLYSHHSIMVRVEVVCSVYDVVGYQLHSHLGYLEHAVTLNVCALELNCNPSGDLPTIGSGTQRMSKTSLRRISSKQHKRRQQEHQMKFPRGGETWKGLHFRNASPS